MPTNIENSILNGLWYTNKTEVWGVFVCKCYVYTKRGTEYENEEDCLSELSVIKRKIETINNELGRRYFEIASRLILMFFRI